MGAIAVTAAQVAPVKPLKCDIESYIATEAIAAGQAVYILTTGKVGVADANSAGKEQFRGIALQSVGAGQAVDVLHKGDVYGFTLSGNADSLAYLSDTAGGLDTSASGSKTVAAGRVVCLPDSPTFTKVLRVFVKLDADW